MVYRNRRAFLTWKSLLLLLLYSVCAQSLKLDNRDDILQVSRTLAADLFHLYHGNETGQTPGILPDDYRYGVGRQYWQSGIFMGTFLDYWHLTGDDLYNNAVMEGIMHQAGSEQDFLTGNWSRSMANDDQCIWALNALSAAEYGFPDHPSTEPQWLDLAKTVFQEQAERWDSEEYYPTCGGGLRWLINSTLDGYHYKLAYPSICFSTLGSRLARFTGNETYATYTEKVWDWMYKIGYIDHQTWWVYEGSSEGNCYTEKNMRSRDPVLLALGAAYMYNYTNGSSEWQERVSNLQTPISVIFTPIETEDGSVPSCVTGKRKCNDGLSAHNSLIYRFLAGMTQLAPFTADTIIPLLKDAAEEMISSCKFNEKGTGYKCYWTSREDVHYVEDLMDAMGALSAVQNLLVTEATVPQRQGDEKQDKSDETDDVDVAKDGENRSSDAAYVQSSCLLMLVLGFCIWLP